MTPFTDSLSAWSDTVRWLDLFTVRETNERTSGWLTDVVSVITHLGSMDIVLGLTIGAVAVLALFRHWHGAVALALSVGLTQVMVTLLKDGVGRDRPPDGMAIDDPSGASFPSAHSATAVAIYAMLALIASRYLEGRARIAAYVGAGVAVAAVGASRIYLGAHYPTDVVGGWLLGGVLVLGCWALASRLPSPRVSAA